MSNRDALKAFARQRVNQEMVDFLAATTESVIQVKSSSRSYRSLVNTSTEFCLVSKKTTSLRTFIKNLIRYSNVQTPTLMASLIYLNKVRSLLPANAVGMETTRHRIFLASLILAAKTLNDSSPLNKHWTKYTDGLLTNEEVNMAERELISLLKWNLTIKEDELVIVLQPFLTSIKEEMAKKMEAESMERTSYYKLSNHLSNKSIWSIASSSSRSTSYSSISSLGSTRGSNSAYSYGNNETFNSVGRQPLAPVSNGFLNIPPKHSHYGKASPFYKTHSVDGHNSHLNETSRILA